MVATLQDGTPVAFENKYEKGSAIIFGSFAGQENYHKPVPMHPLGSILARWAGLTEPDFQAPPLLELRQMSAPNGRFVFFFNHSQKPADVHFSRTLEHPSSAIHEITSGQEMGRTGSQLKLDIQVPGQSVRIYRIDY